MTQATVFFVLSIRESYSPTNHPRSFVMATLFSILLQAARDTSAAPPHLEPVSPAARRPHLVRHARRPPPHPAHPLPSVKLLRTLIRRRRRRRNDRRRQTPCHHVSQSLSAGKIGRGSGDPSYKFLLLWPICKQQAIP